MGEASYTIELTETDRTVFALLVTDYAQRVGSLLEKGVNEQQTRLSEQLKWAIGWADKLERLTDG